MKKLISTMLIITMLVGVFSACSESGGEYCPTTDYPTETHASVQESTLPTTANNINPYQQGTFTSTLYYSEWLNLYLKIPSNMAAADPEAIKLYNEAGSGDEIVEMHVYQNNKEQSPAVQITVAKNASGQTLSQFCNDSNRSIDNALTNLGNGIEVHRIWKDPITYSFLGESYLLYEMNTKTYLNSTLKREGTSWYLYREKGDCFITIYCSAHECDVKVEEILEIFSTYSDAKTGGSSGTPLQPSATQPPTTQPPTTQPPATQSPATEPPVTQPPTTQPPATESITTQPPTTQPPATQAPTVCSHNYATATCTTPKTCTLCGQTSGSALGHTYSAATCTAPKTCNSCGATTGSATGHKWTNITQTVHHEEQGHYEDVAVAKKAQKIKCYACSTRSNTLEEYYSHFDSVHGNDNHYLLVRERYAWIDDWTYEYETKWIVDQEAYTETVVIGRNCRVCGEEE